MKVYFVKNVNQKCKFTAPNQLLLCVSGEWFEFYFVFFLLMANLSPQLKEYVEKRKILLLKKSRQFNVFHDTIFILWSKWIPATAGREPDTAVTKFHVNYTLKMSVSDIDNAVLRDICQTWVCIKSSHLKQVDLKY